MGIAALVLGIVSVVLGFIPLCGIIALLPAIIGLILGIIDLVKRKKAGEKFGKSLAGIICSGLAVVIIVFWYVAFGVAVVDTAKDASKELESSLSELESSFSDYNYNDYNF